MEHAAEGISDHVCQTMCTSYTVYRSIVFQCDCECLWLCEVMQVRSCFKWGCSRDVSTIYSTVPCVCSRYGYDLLLCLLNCTLAVLNLCFL